MVSICRLVFIPTLIFAVCAARDDPLVSSVYPRAHRMGRIIRKAVKSPCLMTTMQSTTLVMKACTMSSYNNKLARGLMA